MALTHYVRAMVVRSLRRFRPFALPVRIGFRTELHLELPPKAGVFGLGVDLDRSGKRVGPILTYYYGWEPLTSPHGGVDHDTH